MPVAAVLAGASLSFLFLFLVQALRARVKGRLRDMANRLLWALAMIALFTFAPAGAPRRNQFLRMLARP